MSYLDDQEMKISITTPNISGSNEICKKETLKIQNLEDYLYDNGKDFVVAKPLDEFPKLFKIRLEKKSENDIDSKISGLQISNAASLYTDLLLANYYESIKQNEKHKK